MTIPATTRPKAASSYSLTVRRRDEFAVSRRERAIVEVVLETIEDPAELASALRDLAEQIDPTPEPEAEAPGPRFQAVPHPDYPGKWTILDHAERKADWFVWSDESQASRAAAGYTAANRDTHSSGAPAWRESVYASATRAEVSS